MWISPKRPFIYRVILISFFCGNYCLFLSCEYNVGTATRGRSVFKDYRKTDNHKTLSIARMRRSMIERLNN